jgi:hypothetical protein
MDKKITYGVAGLVTILAIFGGYLIFTDDELDKAWYCDINGRVALFEELSSTNKTGYWYEDGIRKQSTCTNSKWIPLRDYCESQGFPNCKGLDITPAPVLPDVYTGKWLCRDTCEPLY